MFDELGPTRYRKATGSFDVSLSLLPIYSLFCFFFSPTPTFLSLCLLSPKAVSIFRWALTSFVFFSKIFRFLNFVLDLRCCMLISCWSDYIWWFCEDWYKLFFFLAYWCFLRCELPIFSSNFLSFDQFFFCFCFFALLVIGALRWFSFCLLMILIELRLEWKFSVSSIFLHLALAV